MSVITDFDPLLSPQTTPPPSTRRQSNATTAIEIPLNTSPISFKRVPTTRVSSRLAAGLLGGILNREIDQISTLSSTSTSLPSTSNAIQSQHLHPTTSIIRDRSTINPNRHSSVSFNEGVNKPGGSRWANDDQEDDQSDQEDQDSLLSPHSRRSLFINDENLNPTSLPIDVPLPTLPMIVLCIAMFSEFLSASTAAPFLFFMLESFGLGENGGEAAVGFYCGVVSSVFFLSQFLTSLLWISIAQKHGRRAVLIASLLGNCTTLVVFGTSKNLASAISVRLLQGIFGGAIGVARSTITEFTSPSNEQRAFLYIGLCWGFGGIVGSCVGGIFADPVKNYPSIFGGNVLFTEYPYLLPCLISSSVTFTGAILSCFLNRDGGTGRIHLPTEKDVQDVQNIVGQFPRKLVSKLSSKLSMFFTQQEPLSTTDRVMMRPSSLTPLNSPIPTTRNPLAVSKTSTRQSGYGTAYGYNPLSMSRTSTRQSGNAYGYGVGGPRRRNVSRFSTTSTRYAPDYDDLEHLNFAQRFLLANDASMFSLSDLWVSRATQKDEESIHDDENDESGYGDEESRIDYQDYPEGEVFGFGTAPPSLDDLRGVASRQTDDQGMLSPAPQISPQDTATRRNRRPSMQRVVSNDNRSSYPRKPTIFAHSGLDPTSLASAEPPSITSPTAQTASTLPNSLSSTQLDREETPFNLAAIDESSIIEEDKNPVSVYGQLPLVLIANYAILALHCTVCDQVFMSFLVTPIPAGGLGLKASNFSVLIATMFVFSGIWQFLLYPKLAAPVGPFSHLQMFRLGLILYLPIYFFFPSLRGLLREENNVFLFFGMTMLSAIRYLGNTCCYTAMAILINATTAPHLVPLANGIAQSAVSAARFFGPLVGGSIWAYSIRDGPNAHPYPFNLAFGFFVPLVFCTLGFCFSFRIR